MAEVQVAISQDFFNAFAGIPRAQQKKVHEFVSKFRANPRATGINYEKINDAANENYRSVRIDQDYRGIVFKPDQGNVYLMLWVDKHDDAYQWARKHQCQVNPETGTLQLYEAVHVEPDTDAGQVHPAEHAQEPSTGTELSATPLISLRDREFLRLGVPEDRLTLVQSATTLEQLEALEPRLPVEAFEALCFLADGVPLDEVMEEYAQPIGAKVDPQDYASALQNAQSQRRFRVVEDDVELQNMLEAPLEQWRVFLHPTQRRLVERDWNGPVRVLGGAGTGKTVVAMHRARWLVRHRLKPGEKLLFTTFTRNLAMDIEANLRKICSPQEMKQIEVTNINAWLHRYLKRENYPARIVYPGSDEFERCWDSGMQLASGELDLPDTFYRDEWLRVILSNRVSSQREYFKVSRVGRGQPLTRKQRALIWPVFEEVRFELHQKGFTTDVDAAYWALEHLASAGNAKPFAAAVVDEAQDLGEEVLRLLRELVPEGPNDLMLVGDGHQRIYGRRASFGQCGINIRGRGRKLRINYRTTEQIRRFATAVLENQPFDDMDEGDDSTSGYRSLVNGLAPTLKGFSNDQDEAEWVVAEIQRLQNESWRLQDICIVGRTGIQLKVVEQALKAAGLDSYAVSRERAENTEVPGVRLANMFRIKGLEFKVVFIVGASEGVLPLAQAMNSASDPIERRAKELGERALFHVAGTRAVQGLYVTWNGQPSIFLP